MPGVKEKIIMVQKISAELSVVAATPELAKAVACDLELADGDLEELLKKAEADERNSPKDDTKSVS
jgi:hypothetical protein